VEISQPLLPMGMNTPMSMPGPPHKKGSPSFFEKKEAKKLYSSQRNAPHSVTKEAKVFWFFFSKKNVFLFYRCTVSSIP
jgi:hypothetical protein